MAWLDSLFSRERRALVRARALFDRGAFDEALSVLADFAGPTADTLRHEVLGRAARHHLEHAVEACRQGEADTMKQRLARARRYHVPALEPAFRDALREIREHQIRLTAPEHWLGLLTAATQQRDAFYADGDLQAPPRHGLFASRRLQHALRELSDGSGATLSDLELVLRADRPTLRRLSQVLGDVYPDDLAVTIPRLGDEFTRAVLFLSVARPDLAALPLVELPESDPLVCFERARTAHLLGLPRLAITALQSFATLVGGHRTIRRLNTGVFLAQMAVAVGEPHRALAVLDDLPVRFLGRRPVVLHARLLMEAGRLEPARELLADHLSRAPDHEEAAALLRDVRSRTTFGPEEAPLPTLAHFVAERPFFSEEYAVAPPRERLPPRAPLDASTDRDEI